MKAKCSLFDSAETEIPKSTKTAEESWSQMLSFLYSQLSNLERQFFNLVIALPISEPIFL